MATSDESPDFKLGSHSAYWHFSNTACKSNCAAADSLGKDCAERATSKSGTFFSMAVNRLIAGNSGASSLTGTPVVSKNGACGDLPYNFPKKFDLFPMIVTIDGPAGTGKSTVARILADRLGFEFLNTGAMYRAVAYACLQRNIELTDQAAVGHIPTLLEIQFIKNRLILNGVDVTDAIRGQDVTQSASLVAANAQVRERLVELQRAAAFGRDLVTEGRDQGTVVFPDAQCKFFLTASAEERARRRQRELQEKGESISLEELLAQQKLRDVRDETRACSPLKPAENSKVIDTTEMSLDAVAGYLESIVRSDWSFRNPPF